MIIPGFEIKQKANKSCCIVMGMCILDLSIILMYECNYGCIKNKYDNNSRLLFTGTDSLMYEIKTEDIYEDFRKDKEIFVFSNYSK